MFILFVNLSICWTANTRELPDIGVIIYHTLLCVGAIFVHIKPRIDSYCMFLVDISSTHLYLSVFVNFLPKSFTPKSLLL